MKIVSGTFSLLPLFLFVCVGATNDFVAENTDGFEDTESKEHTLHLRSSRRVQVYSDVVSAGVTNYAEVLVTPTTAPYMMSGKGAYGGKGAYPAPTNSAPASGMYGKGYQLQSPAA